MGTVPFLSVLALLTTANVASAQALQPDVVYGNAVGCALVRTGDFNTDSYLVVTTRYLQGHEWSCEFVQALLGKHGDMFVNAICSGEGETSPDTFAITSIAEDGTIAITAANGESVAPMGNPISACEGLTADQADRVFGGY